MLTVKAVRDGRHRQEIVRMRRCLLLIKYKTGVGAERPHREAQLVVQIRLIGEVPEMWDVHVSNANDVVGGRGAICEATCARRLVREEEK